MKVFNKILIANRGEIAVRVIGAAQKSGIQTVAIYAADDVDSQHVLLADEAKLLPGRTLEETYLNQKKIIQIALESHAEAIHPGYGFLSENAGFAQKVADAGLVFIGPTSENIRLMGEKNQALCYVKSLGISTLPSFRGTVDELCKQSSEMNFPVMVKISGGGGGKGMVICNSDDELLTALEKAERQGNSYFGKGELFVETYLPHARHIEIQLLADQYGNAVHFFERECSVQRKFQKIIEEAPSPSVNGKLRLALTSTALKIARSMNYQNAGTVEFLLDENMHYYFLEMNTRIQVEHPVTEMITNTDLVSLQLIVAAGNPLPVKQEEIEISGHAIEIRLCAEDVGNKFKPSAGKLELWKIPEYENLRIETYVKEGHFVSPNYDSLLAKLIVWSETRDLALQKMKHVLSETAISAIHTNQSFLAELIESESFRLNKVYTGYIDDHLDQINNRIQRKRQGLNKHKLVIAYLLYHLQQNNQTGNSVWYQIGYWRICILTGVCVDNEKIEVQMETNQFGQLFRINQEEYQVLVLKRSENLLKLQINEEIGIFYYIENENETLIVKEGFQFSLRSNLLMNQVLVKPANVGVNKGFQNLICADLFGKVLKIHVIAGQKVHAGQLLLTMESMKTEIHVLCPSDGFVAKTHIKVGTAVVEKQLLIELEESKQLL
jgi:3-methylcrotonyl-CoA carboxylase alpha subunit